MKITVVRKAEKKTPSVAACPWVIEMMGVAKSK
jgi:hypothetical protein